MQTAVFNSQAQWAHRGWGWCFHEPLWPHQWIQASPMQFSLFTSYPGGQMHLKDPSKFWQVPGEQEPGSAMHSLVSLGRKQTKGVTQTQGNHCRLICLLNYSSTDSTGALWSARSPWTKIPCHFTDTMEASWEGGCPFFWSVSSCTFTETQPQALSPGKTPPAMHSQWVLNTLARNVPWHRSW